MVGANSSRARLERCRMAEVHEHHVPAGEQLGVRTEHRVHRGHLAAVRLQRQQPRAQRRLERADIEDHARRTAQREIAQDRIGDAERRREHDEVVLQIGAAPVVDARDACGAPAPGRPPRR